MSDLLRKAEDIKLAPELLDPEPPKIIDDECVHFAKILSMFGIVEGVLTNFGMIFYFQKWRWCWRRVDVSWKLVRRSHSTQRK